MELWQPITGFEGRYEISDKGRVKSLRHKQPIRGGSVAVMSEKILKPFWVSNNGNRQGHLAIQLGRGTRRQIHHLVLEEFVCQRPAGAIGCHWDDDPENNAAENLYWGTYTSNAHDGARNGTTPQFIRKTHCKCGQLKEGVRPNGTTYCKPCNLKQSRESKARARANGRAKDA